MATVFFYIGISLVVILVYAMIGFVLYEMITSYLRDRESLTLLFIAMMSIIGLLPITIACGIIASL